MYIFFSNHVYLPISSKIIPSPSTLQLLFPFLGTGDFSRLPWGRSIFRQVSDRQESKELKLTCVWEGLKKWFNPPSMAALIEKPGKMMTNDDVLGGGAANGSNLITV